MSASLIAPLIEPSAPRRLSIAAQLDIFRICFSLLCVHVGASSMKCFSVGAYARCAVVIGRPPRVTGWGRGT